MLTDERDEDFHRDRCMWWWIVVGLIAWASVYNYYLCAATLECLWKKDFTEFTGSVTIVFGIFYSVLIDKSYKESLKKWHDAAIIDLTPKESDEICQETHRFTRKWCIFLSLILLLITIPQLIYYHKENITSLYSDPSFHFDVNCKEPFSYKDRYCPDKKTRLAFISYIISSFFYTVLVGRRLGRSVGHGYISHMLRKKEIPLFMSIKHPDGAGGTALIGRFYFLQASLFLIPIAWLSLFLLVINLDILNGVREYLGLRERAEEWLVYYTILVFFAIVLFTTVFIVPMCFISKLIKKWKREKAQQQIALARGRLIVLRKQFYITPKQIELYHNQVRDLHDWNNLPDWPASRLAINTFLTTLVTSIIGFLPFIF